MTKKKPHVALIEPGDYSTETLLEKYRLIRDNCVDMILKYTTSDAKAHAKQIYALNETHAKAKAYIKESEGIIEAKNSNRTKDNGRPIYRIVFEPVDGDGDA
jgi:hypothetical protein|tara:strand:+ start:910 stop:1215 length:306 start_codon:yes stop_codon:yes gene_type:complete